MRCWLLALALAREAPVQGLLAGGDGEVVRSTADLRVGLVVDSRGVTKVAGEPGGSKGAEPEPGGRAPEPGARPGEAPGSAPGSAAELAAAADAAASGVDEKLSKLNKAKAGLRPSGSMAAVPREKDPPWVKLERDTIVRSKFESLQDGSQGLDQEQFREFYAWFMNKAHVPFGKDRPQPDAPEADAQFEQLRTRGADYRGAVVEQRQCGGGGGGAPALVGAPHARLEDAEVECTRLDQACKGIYDAKCAAKVTDADAPPQYVGPFVLCSSTVEYEASAAGCVYERRENNGLAEWDNVKDFFFPYEADADADAETSMLMESPNGEPVSKKLRMHWRVEFTKMCVPDAPPLDGCQLDLDQLIRQLDPDEVYRPENKELAHKIIDSFEGGPEKDGKLTCDEFVNFMEQTAMQRSTEPASVSPDATQKQVEAGSQSRTAALRDTPKAVDENTIDAAEHQRNAENDADLKDLMAAELVGGDFEGSDPSLCWAAALAAAAL